MKISSFSKYKHRKFRPIARSIYVMGFIAVIIIATFVTGIYLLFPASSSPHQSLSKISVSTVNDFTKVSPNSFSCNSCSKNIQLEFTLASSSTYTTNVTVKSLTIESIENQIKSTYSSDKLQIFTNNEIQNTPLILKNQSNLLIKINVTSSAEAWNVGTYVFNITLFFDSPFSDTKSFQLNPESFSLIQSIPSGIEGFVPISLTNTQNVSTSAPFQQMITISNPLYQQYEAPDLSNLEFLDSQGKILTSWLENVGSDSGSSTYWVSLPDGIKANSTVTIYLGFANLSTNLFNGVEIGEASQLSPIYGEYNNIGNIMLPGLLFQYYYDKNGTFNSQNYQYATYQAGMSNNMTLAYTNSAFQSYNNPNTTSLNGQFLTVTTNYGIFGSFKTPCY